MNYLGRLAVEHNGEVIVYDTLDHNIGGVSQQQGGYDSLSFSSQYGSVAVNSLPVVLADAPSQPQPQPAPSAASPNAQPASLHSSSDEIIVLLEQLGRLRDSGVLTVDEFDSKKQELLARI